MRPVALYDACVLFPAPLRDLLLRLAISGIVRARWSDAILDECFASILRERPELSAERLQRTREAMNASIVDALVTGYEPLIGELSLPDPNDRHVLAAAIRAGAQVIVTFNLRDFPQDKLAPFDIEARHPDDFVLDLLERTPGLVLTTLQRQVVALKNPTRSLGDLLETLANQGLTQSVARLRDLLGAG